jgi:hydroxymethylpyrimidine pyrophosphatase-like HAD family hydrolase
MIERSGLGFAVNNANDRLKEKAIVLNRSNNEGAISELIEKYAYSR